MKKLLGLVLTAAFLLGAAPLFAAGSTEAKEYSLVFDPGVYTVKTATYDGQTFSYRAYEGIVYVRNPVDVAYQTLNFYVRTEFYEGGSVGGYTADTAPIWFPNSVGGYMPAPASMPGLSFEGKTNSLVVALAKGLVVAAPGARGRTLQDASGVYYGKAPAVIVDLKAAVRYLRYNDAAMPGDAERIVSNGTSAGGAVSVLLGATGNNADYEPYLAALGAADARDDIWAVSAYCPITNLDNADSAYEWLLGGLSKTKEQGPMPVGTPGMPAGLPAGVASTTVPQGGQTTANPWGAPNSSGASLTDAQKKLSARLAALFPAYLDSLNLTTPDGKVLTLAADGSGPFKDYLETLVLDSAQASLKAGVDFSAFPFVTVKDGVVTDIDWDQFIAFMGRKKSVPAFDGLDLSSGENNLFGTETIDNRHFTAFGAANSAVAATSADQAIVKLMNPMDYIGTEGTTTSRYWRIRHGTVDSDTSIAVPVILAAYLGDKGCSVDFALPWNVPHSGDYDLDDNFAWVASLTK
ncbi:MAG TPA: subtype B tannase [Rectinemataceae bacterium]|nr:subtype B tannase [Rectinemataceae bacterium]